MHFLLCQNFKDEINRVKRNFDRVKSTFLSTDSSVHCAKLPILTPAQMFEKRYGKPILGHLREYLELSTIDFSCCLKVELNRGHPLHCWYHIYIKKYNVGHGDKRVIILREQFLFQSGGGGED